MEEAAYERRCWPGDIYDPAVVCPVLQQPFVEVKKVIFGQDRIGVVSTGVSAERRFGELGARWPSRR
ncbi:hypothetical protein Arub01_25730 [Actinomadura rubrobrunea]|uniref:Uncharacterized protein n=1 Tax=Actinomadura rubrobrunea TaxID=115335 RepID=A0A9W6PWG6_9ACTN|nr:hypothetical protein Arub01_25730 [Actinomadura rubrobrunea]